MSKEKPEQSAPSADEPTEVVPAAPEPVVPPALVVPPEPVALPEPAPRDTRVSRGWMIGATAAGGLIVLVLTFGGGIATGLAIGHHAGSTAERGAPGTSLPHGDSRDDDRDRDQQRP
jgi:hypothetical protein